MTLGEYDLRVPNKQLSLTASFLSFLLSLISLVSHSRTTLTDIKPLPRGGRTLLPSSHFIPFLVYLQLQYILRHRHPRGHHY